MLKLLVIVALVALVLLVPVCLVVLVLLPLPLVLLPLPLVMLPLVMRCLWSCAASGPAVSGPAACGPAASGPVASGPTASGPVGPGRGPSGGGAPVGADSGSGTRAGPSGGSSVGGATPGPFWADMVATGESIDIPSLPVPIPREFLGGHLPRPNTIVLHTQAFRDITVREVMDALLQNTSLDVVKSLQQIPGPRYCVTFRQPEAKQEFLGREFTLRGERIIVQEVEAPVLDLRLLYVPDEVSNQVVAESLGKYGKVLRVDREMYRNWPVVETGVRVVKLSELSEGIPRKIFVGPYPTETRYIGEVPQCSRCGQYGHRVATCINNIKCFRCGQNGHVQRQCFKCFLCGQFGHIRASCPDRPSDRPLVGTGPVVGSVHVSRPMDVTPAAPTPPVNRPGDDRPPAAPQNASSTQRDLPHPRDPGPDLPSSQDMDPPERRLHRSQEKVVVAYSDTGLESSDADSESDFASRTIHTDDSHSAGHRVELNKRLGGDPHPSEDQLTAAACQLNSKRRKRSKQKKHR